MTGFSKESKSKPAMTVKESKSQNNPYKHKRTSNNP